tara:strand:+ start:1529 stop:1915 length:387 start_codon:yes stop_codon:yes gene_type:complete
MPTYEYRCEECQSEFDKVLPMARYNEPQECPSCKHNPAKKLVSVGSGFILKGDGWAGKNNRISGQMRNKNRNLTRRQMARKKDATIHLAPNVDGERVDTWSEATSLAKSKGKDTSGYSQRAAVEKKGE